MDSSTFFAGALPVVVGHRGDPHRHPENSLAGIVSGLGADGAVEIDVRLSADGRLLLSHDSEIGDVPVATTNWADLADRNGAGAPCLLDEAISVPGRLDIEVKNLPGEPGFDPDGRLALMAASRARPSDIVTSFFWPDLARIRERSPDVATGLLVGAGGSGLDAVAVAAEDGHVAVAAHDSVVDAALLAAASRESIPILAWTVNDEGRARELSRAGVAAIITDRPHAILSALGRP